MATHIIYIPGLGDRYDGFRRFALMFWRFWGVSVEYVPVTWYDGGDFEQKIKYVDDAIKRAGDKRVALVGESAGATLALHASIRYKNIGRVITLCGVSQPGTPISSYLRRRAPALNTAVSTLPQKFDVDVHSMRGLVDTTVGRRWSKTNQATVHTIWVVGHRATIITCLTLLAPLMVAIAKK